MYVVLKSGLRVIPLYHTFYNTISHFRRPLFIEGMRRIHVRIGMLNRVAINYKMQTKQVRDNETNTTNGAMF